MPAAASDYPPTTSSGCGAVLAPQQAAWASLQASPAMAVPVRPCPHAGSQCVQSRGLWHHLKCRLPQPLRQVPRVALPGRVVARVVITGAAV